jgi:hypothetical protein
LDEAFYDVGFDAGMPALCSRPGARLCRTTGVLNLAWLKIGHQAVNGRSAVWLVVETDGTGLS